MKHMLSLLLGILLFSASQAQVYEWFDEDGNRHFSDQKPEGVDFRALGDSAANLSSYQPDYIQQSRPLVDQRRHDSSSSGQSRRSAAGAAADDRKAACAGYLTRIDRIQARLRAGYGEPRGNRLRAERSALRTAYWRNCN